MARGKKGTGAAGPIQKKLEALAVQVAGCIESRDISLDIMQEMVGLVARPDTVMPLIGLLVAEEKRTGANDFVREAYHLIFSTLLSEIGFLEDNSLEKEARLEAIQDILVEKTRTGEISPELLLTMMHFFGEENLDVGDELRETMEDAVRAAPEPFGSGASSGSGGPLDALSPVANPFADLLEKVEGDIFQLSGFLVESAEMMPPETAVQMLPVTLFAEEEGLREGVLGCLLSGKSYIREGLLDLLGQAALQGKITGVMLRRMISIRNWLPENERKKLDIAIKDCRKAKVSCASWPEVKNIREIWSSGVDGAGAQTLFIVAKEGRRHAFVSILLKQGKGVRDAWVVHQLTLAEIKNMFLPVKSQLYLFESDMDYVTSAVRHFLSVNAQSGELPSFRVLEVAEAIGMSDLNPSASPVRTLVDELYGRITEDFDNEFRSQVLERSNFLLQDHPVAQSWFVEGTQIGSIVQVKGSVAKKTGLLLEGPMEERRDWWAELFVWMGMALLHCDLANRIGKEENASGWVEFAVIARAIVDGMPLGDIPIMQEIAEVSFRAQPFRA